MVDIPTDSVYNTIMETKEMEMQVFVLLGVTHYEGETLLGVYATEQEALTAYDVYLHDHIQFHDVKVEDRAVGAPAEMRW